MNFKCAYCDPVVSRGSGSKPKRSIDSDVDKYIKDDKDKYYHDHCYREYWQNRKSGRLTEEEVDALIDSFKEKQVADLKEMEEKDKFLTWIMEYYDGTLSTYYLRKLQSIRDGKYDGVSEPIDYFTLYDIYNYMKGYLNKIAMKKHFDSIGLRMNYDLAIVVGNIGDYKKYKERLKQEDVQVKVIEENLKRTTSYRSDTKHNYKNDNDFNISDHINDLIL